MALLALVDVHLGADDDRDGSSDGRGTAIETRWQHESVNNRRPQAPQLADDGPPGRRAAPAWHDAERNHRHAERRNLGTDRARRILEAADHRFESIARQARDDVEDELFRSTHTERVGE